MQLSYRLTLSTLYFAQKPMQFKSFFLRLEGARLSFQNRSVTDLRNLFDQTRKLPLFTGNYNPVGSRENYIRNFGFKDQKFGST